MRRKINIVTGGLRRKITLLVLVTLILVSISTIMVVSIRLQKLRELIINENNEQRDSVEEISTAYLERSVVDRAEKTSRLQANLVDTMFSDVSQKVEVLAERVAACFANDFDYSFLTVSTPDPADEGVIKLRLCYAPGVDPTTPENRKLIGKIALAEDLMCSLFKRGGLDNCYVGLPQGLGFVADDSSLSKIDEDGRPSYFDVVNRPWYKGAVSKKGLFFSNIQADIFTGRVGVACSLPVYVEGEIVAVVGADLFLGTLDSMVTASNTGDEFFFVINDKGQVVFAPDDQDLVPSDYSVASKDLRLSEDKDLSEFITITMKGDRNPYIVTSDSGIEYIMVGSTMEIAGWSLISASKRSAALSFVPQMRNVFDNVAEYSSEEYASQFNLAIWSMVLVLVILMLIGIIWSLLLGKRIANPLVHLTKYITQLRNGDFVFKMDEVYKTNDEIEVLAKAFEDLSERNQNYIKQVTKITAEKERIGAELNVATQIQADMLPSIFPAYPQRGEFDVYASMVPAREVGGDFYDFFLVDEDHLALVIADVSGKGVPAALFMVIAKTLIKNRTLMGGSPSQILYDVNNQLFEGNRTEFFVTVWLAIIDLKTGKGIVSNAGHEHPAIKRAGGSFELLKYKHSPAVAMMEDMQFPDHEFQMNKGDCVFVYTDGVVESTDSSNQLFGEDRMLEALNKNPDAPLDILLKTVKNDIDGFVDGAEQFDDITMLCMEYTGCKES